MIDRGHRLVGDDIAFLEGNSHGFVKIIPNNAPRGGKIVSVLPVVDVFSGKDVTQ